MAFEITSLQALDPTLVQQMLASTRTRLLEEHPSLDLKRGVFHDTVVYYHAVMESMIRTNLERYLSARSLMEIEADPTLADGDVVDSVMSLYRVARREGSSAYGQVTVVISDSTTVTIQSGSVWVANGMEFTATQAFTAKVEEELIANDSDRLMTLLSDGNYAFQIDVVATEEGEESRLAKDTQIIPNAPPTNFLTSYVTEDFQGGTSEETNTELIQRLQAGLAAKTISNRVNMEAMLQEFDQFAGISGMSIVGYGDAEMLRDKHSVFPVSYGGRVDWYIRGQVSLHHVSLQKEAVLIEKPSESTTGIWQISILRDDAPGFYEIRNIRLTGVDASNVSGGFGIINEQRGLDLSGSGFIPDIQTQEEGEYSRFQTSIVQFSDTETDVSEMSLGDKQLYDVEAVGTSLIGDIQDLVSGRDIRSHGADALIKAPIPCFVQINFTINKRTGDPDPDLDAVRQSIMSVVNRVGFIGRLDASRIHDAVHGYLTGAMSVTDMDLFGRIRRPDGSMLYLRDSESLVLTGEPENMVTTNTVQFFVEEGSIGITVESTVPVPV